MQKSGIKCVFFDRDGIVNQSPGAGKYVLDWSGFRLIPEFPDCLRAARRHGYECAVVTNQRCIALGLTSIGAVEDIHRRLREFLEREHGLTLLDVAYCPHDDGQCACRKPAPGMLLALAERHAIDLSGSWMVGDSERDVEAGHRAGCRAILAGDPQAPSRADARCESVQKLPFLLDALL